MTFGEIEVPDNNEIKHRLEDYLESSIHGWKNWELGFI